MTKPARDEMTAPIDQIKVNGRFRKFYGKLEGLADSIARHGLLQPVVVDKEYNLLAGGRRLAAARLAKLREVPIRILDGADPTEVEYDENVHRLDFTPSEKVAIAEAVRKRMGGDGRKGDQHWSSGNEGRAKGRWADIIAEQVGFSSRMEMERAKKVVTRGAKALVDAMDDGTVKTTHAAQIADLPKAQQAEVVEKIRGGVPACRSIEEVTNRVGSPQGDAYEGDEEPPDPRCRDHGQCDHRGKQIPARLLDPFNSPIIDDACILLRGTIQKLQGCFKWNKFLPLADIRQHLLIASELLDAARPHAVCPVCGGIREKAVDCKLCRGGGFLDANAWCEYEASGGQA